MWRIYLVGAVPALAGAAYLIFYIFRILTKFFHVTMSWSWWLLVIALAIGLSLPAANFFSVWAVGYYYFIAISIVLDIIARFTPAGVSGVLRSGIISLLVVAVAITYGYINMNHVVLSLIHI